MGRPSKFKPEFIQQAEKLCKLGATDIEVADFFDVEPTEDQFLCKWLQLRRENRLGVFAVRKKRLTPSGRVVNAMRARLWAALKGRTDGALFSRLPYSRDELVAHLGSKFSAGMTWDNYGKWHVDHIRPCALFNQVDPAQFAECWSLSNLQPLWAHDNVKKGAKYGAP